MSIYSYEVFDTVVKTGSFLKASEELHLSPSAVSHSIARLEEQFQVRLFNRSHNQISLTAAGERLHPYIQGVMHQEIRLQQEAIYLHGEAIGSVRFGTPNSVCRTWVPEMIRSFQRRFPGIEVKIAEGTYDHLLEWVRMQSVDIAILPYEILPDPNLILLHEDQVLCVAPADFRPVNGSFVTAEDLCNNPFIHFTGRNNPETERFLKTNNIEVGDGFSVEDAFTLVTMVECGFGLGILTEITARGIDKNVQYFPMHPDSHRTLGLLEVDPEYETRAVRLFRDHVKEYLTDIGEAELL